MTTETNHNKKAPSGTARGEAREMTSGDIPPHDSTLSWDENQEPTYAVDWTAEIERLEMQSRIVALQLEQARLFAALEMLDGGGA